MTTSLMTMVSEVTVDGSTATLISPSLKAESVLKPDGLPTTRPCIAIAPDVSFPVSTSFRLTFTWVTSEPAFSTTVLISEPRLCQT